MCSNVIRWTNSVSTVPSQLVQWNKLNKSVSKYYYNSDTLCRFATSKIKWCFWEYFLTNYMKSTGALVKRFIYLFKFPSQASDGVFWSGNTQHNLCFFSWQPNKIGIICSVQEVHFATKLCYASSTWGKLELTSQK